MRRKRTLIIVTATVAGLAAAGTGLGLAASGDDDEPAITGRARQRASAAALEHTGGGRVTETEVGDEESYYEVEVTLDDGRQVDVQLNEDFDVVGSSADDDSGEDDADG